MNLATSSVLGAPAANTAPSQLPPSLPCLSFPICRTRTPSCLHLPPFSHPGVKFEGGFGEIKLPRGREPHFGAGKGSPKPLKHRGCRLSRLWGHSAEASNPRAPPAPQLLLCSWNGAEHQDFGRYGQVVKPTSAEQQNGRGDPFWVENGQNGQRGGLLSVLQSRHSLRERCSEASVLGGPAVMRTPSGWVGDRPVPKCPPSPSGRLGDHSPAQRPPPRPCLP